MWAETSALEPTHGTVGVAPSRRARPGADVDPLDAYQLDTQAVESPLANVCDNNYTSMAKMAKRYLGGGGPMNGAHARLRDLAGEYRR